MSEKAFQNYFLRVSRPSQKISPDGNPGVPDTEIIRGLKTYRVELKLLLVGPSGNKKLKGVFKHTQAPWYAKFLQEGGKGLYICFKLNSGYGLLKVDKKFCLNIPTIKYLDLLEYEYKEYKTLKELLDVNFP